jgi:hypothetical protein
MSTCRLIVCERTSRWAAALRRALVQRPGAVASVRGLAQCREALALAPASLVAIEVTADNVGAVVDFVAGAGHSPQTRVAALIPAGLANAPLETAELETAELLLREAGAVDVLTTLAQAPRLARLYGRHERLAPAEGRNFQQLVSERLPWPALASA